MSKKHEKVIAAIFSDHLSANIHWKEIESLLAHLGAEFHEAGGARLLVRLRGHEATLHRPHHGAAVAKNELHHLRQFLTAAGVDGADE